MNNSNEYAQYQESNYAQASIIRYHNNTTEVKSTLKTTRKLDIKPLTKNKSNLNRSKMNSYINTNLLSLKTIISILCIIVISIILISLTYQVRLKMMSSLKSIFKTKTEFIREKEYTNNDEYMKNLYFSNNTKINYNSNLYNEKRQLLINKFDYVNNCNSSIKANSTYHSGLNKSLNLIEFSSQYTDYNEDMQQDLLNTLLDTNTNLFSVINNKILGSIVLLIIASLVIVIWVVICFCIYEPRYCFKSDKTIDNISNNPFFASITISIIILIIVIFCCLGFVYSDNFEKEIEKFQCALLKYNYDTIYGSVDNESTKWTGVSNVIDNINTVSFYYSSIEKEYGFIYNNISWVSNAREELSIKLNNIYQNYSEAVVTSPFPEYSGNYIPKFIKYLGPVYNTTTSNNNSSSTYYTTNTYPFYILKDFSEFIEQTAVLVNNTRDLIRTYKDEINTTKIFKNISDNIYTTFNNFSVFDEEYISYLLDKKADYLNIIKIGLITLFGSSFILVVMFFSTTMMFVHCESKSAKILINIIMNLLLIITILLFIASSLFGILGQIFIDFTPIIKAIFTKDNINKLFVNNNGLSSGAIEDSNIITETYSQCLNSTGDLSNLYINNLKYLNYVSELYSNSFQILEAYKHIISLDNSTNSTIILKQAIENRIFDVNIIMDAEYLFTDYKNSSLTTEGKESVTGLNQYSDRNLISTKQIDCKNYTYDHFIANNNTSVCPSTYILVNSDSNSNDSSTSDNNVNRLGDNSCLVLTSWNYDEISSRYKDFVFECAGESSASGIKSHILEYYYSISNYIVDVNILLNKLLIEFGEVEQLFIKYNNKLFLSLDRINKFMTPISSIINDQVNSTNIYDLFNCHYIAVNVNNIIATSNDIAYKIKNICLVLALLGVFNLIALFSGLIFYLRKYSIYLLKIKLMEVDSSSVYDKNTKLEIV